MEYREFITSETQIGELLMQYPVVIPVLVSMGMECVGCPSSQRESLADACFVHGLQVEPLVRALNFRIAAAKDKGEA